MMALHQLLNALSAGEWVALIVVFCLLAMALCAPIPAESTDF